MSPQTLQILIPLVIIIPIILLRARKMSRKQPLKLGLLLIRPIILLVVCALYFLVPQPGVPPHQFVPMDGLLLGLAAVIGVVGGWYMGRTMTIDVHPEDGTLMVQASPIGLLVILGLVAVRMAIRAGAKMEAESWHLDVALIFDALIIFTAALFVVRSLEMYLRAKKVMEQAKTLP
jgi:hypothetical protein